MLDHIFLTVLDTERSIKFYSRSLRPIGIIERHDYDGKDGPVGHPDLKGFGASGRMFFWLRQGEPSPGAVHVGFVASSEPAVAAAYDAAIAAGATSIHAPGPQLHYDPRYFASQVRDLVGNTRVCLQELAARKVTMMEKKADFHAVAARLINATNAFDTDAVTALFTPDAVIDDPSTGERFDGHDGIRDYVERFFVGYKTVTRLLTVEAFGPRSARLRVDFTGDFGHEVGRLDVRLDSTGLIERIDADLE
ncbi:nuclear transport factor 2 family protein [Rhizobium sp. NPDC090275]|uniref:nuclear transport factor 2 family protein n=1 Tax=Rhizobium sp. NPDC090275 TaxID=3364498 RepID=UPI00383BEF6D